MGPLMYQKDLCVHKKICSSVFLSVCVKRFVCLSKDFLRLYFCVCVCVEKTCASLFKAVYLSCMCVSVCV